MARLLKMLAAMCIVMGSLAVAPVAAADFPFQFVNDSERDVSIKLFSRAGTHREWPSKTKSYSIRPNAAVQELKIDCDEGEQICWGAWATVQSASGMIGQRDVRAIKFLSGAGDRGIRACTDCCHVCKGGEKSPVAKLGDPETWER